MGCHSVNTMEKKGMMIWNGGCLLAYKMSDYDQYVQWIFFLIFDRTSMINPFFCFPLIYECVFDQLIDDLMFPENERKKLKKTFELC